MVGRRDTGHRGQGDVRHGSHFEDMHKNPNEHVATCIAWVPTPPKWRMFPTQVELFFPRLEVRDVHTVAALRAL